MNDAYGDELAIVPHVKHEIVAIAPTLDCHIILLKSPATPENFALIKAQCDGLHLSYVPKKRVENNTRVLVGHEQHDLCDTLLESAGLPSSRADGKGLVNRRQRLCRQFAVGKETDHEFIGKHVICRQLEID